MRYHFFRIAPVCLFEGEMLTGTIVNIQCIVPDANMTDHLYAFVYVHRGSYVTITVDLLELSHDAL